MAYPIEIGDQETRKEVYDTTLRGFAERLYKFKQVVSETSTGGWKNTFWRENPAVATAPTGNAFKGIPRLANFPQAGGEWEEVSSWILKHGCEKTIAWEEILAENWDLQGRTLYKISEAVAKSVDDNIWDTLTENRSVVNIQSITHSDINLMWDGASTAALADLGKARRLIAEYNYPTDNLYILVSPKGAEDLTTTIIGKGSQFQSLGDEAARNGKVAKIMGIGTIIESNSVTASYAAVVVPKVCATLRTLVPFQTNVTEDPFKSVRVRAVEECICDLTDPKAVVLITGTQGVA